jgi:hypothetical protein
VRSGAEQVARIVADCRSGRLARLTDVEAPHAEAAKLDAYGRKVCAEHEGPVIDATAIHDSIPYGKKFNLYEFGCVRPPWPKGWLGYARERGDVYVMVWWEEDLARKNPWPEFIGGQGAKRPWSDVAGVSTCIVYAGGLSQAEDGGRAPFPTLGPIITWSWAYDAEGVALDVRGEPLLLTLPPPIEQGCQLTALYAFNFLNCRNVEIVEPRRERHQRRRLERLGVQVSEIVVTSIGQWARRTSSDPVEAGAVPLTSVRGHIIRSGVEGRKHLFGYDGQDGRPLVEGRFYVPQHVRGSADHGVREQEFTLEPSEESMA